MKDSQINSLAEAIKVNSTLEHLCLGWTGLGDDGAAVIAAALAQNEGLKSVDLRNNNLSHKAIRHLTNALRGNITLLDLKLSEVAPLAVDGDDIIINKDSSGIKRQEGQDLAELQAVVDSNRVLAKCFTGESVKAVLRGRGLSSVPSLILVVTTLVTLDLSHNRLTTVPRAIRQLSWLEHLKLNHNRIAKLPLEIGLLPAIKKIELQHNELVHLPATIALLETLEFLSVHHNRLRSISLSLVSLPRLKHVNFSHNPHLPVLRQYLHEHPILAAKSSQVVSSSTSPSSSSSAVGAAAADSDEEAEREREEGGEVVPGANGMQILQESNQLSTRVYKIRLMCVGQANVGKTSLIDYLVRKSRSDGSTPPAPSSLAALYEYDDSSSASSSSNNNNNNNNNNFQTSNPKSLKNFGKKYSDRNANLRDWSLKHKDKTNQKEAASPSSSPSSSSSIPVSSSSSSQQQTSTPSPLYPYLNTNLATDGISIREWHSSITLSPNDKLSSSRKKASPSLYNNNGNSEEVTVTFSSWDFAGQEIYYYTHLFFLSSRGIYLLCFNLLKPEEEVSRIEYWLQSIYTRGRGAPVILVGTHLDNKKCSKRYLDNLYATLLQKFSGTFKNIRFFFALSCSTGKGIEDLRKKVTELALSIIEQEREVPQPYITLEEKLRAISAVKPQPVLSWQEFEAVGATCGIPQPLVTKAAEYLHSLGSIVYFNEPASGLNDLVVLDCQWLTNVFADVISLKHNFVKDGILLKKDLPQIWKAPLYPQEVHSSLVALLEKFEVAYDIPLTGEEKDISAAAALQAVEKSRAGSNGGSGGGEVSSLLQGKILIPCLLPEDYPADLHKPGMWPKFLNEDKDLSLVTAANNSSSNNTTASTTPIIQLARYYAFEFMPFGFFNRIMVRLLRSDWVLKRCWKNGMFFVKKQDRLLLEMDPEVPYRLRLFMRGPAPAKQMLVLIASIETLVSDWLRVNVKVLIPCIHCIREHNTKPHLFTLAELEEAVANGQTVVNCRAVDTVSIYSLAPDVAMSELDRPTIPYSSFKFLERIAGNDFTEVWKAALAGPSTGKQQQQSQQQLNQKAKAITSSKPKASTNQAEEIVAVKKFFRKRPPSKNAALPDATTVEDDDMAANSNALAAFRDFRSEVWLMSGLEHPNIVRLKGFCTTPTLCMAMEYMECGTLHDYL
ncbi:Myotubularin-like phosphatase domain, variant 2, partial [Balamuthia mandrillaris]